MKKLTSTLTLLLAFTLVFAQNKDPKAKTILEELSKKNKTYTSIGAEFSYQIVNKDAGVDETQKGSLLLKGNKYILKMVGQEIYFDEKYVWTFIPDAKEVNKDCAPDPSEKNESLLNPSNIFSIYEKGFKYSYEKEATVNGVKVHVINLFPENPEGKNYHTIVLNIDKVKQEIISMVVKGKNGNVYTTTVTKFTPNIPASDASFTFDESKADDVIDLCD